MGMMPRKKNIGMSYINRKRRSQVIWSIWSDFDGLGKKTIFNRNKHTYDILRSTGFKGSAL